MYYKYTNIKRGKSERGDWASERARSEFAADDKADKNVLEKIYLHK